MYKILGADHQEYGPVPAEVVLQWINEGRANANTRIRLADSTEWKRLVEVPEFAAAVPPLTPPPISLPSVPPCTDPDALARLLLGRGARIDPVQCLSRGWDLVKANFWLTVGATFVVSSIISVISAVPHLGLLIGPMAASVLYGGLYFMFLKLVRGQPADFSDAFAGFSHSFVPLFFAGIVTTLLTGLGFVMCLLPGIYLAVVWAFTPALVIDKKIDFWPAMELGRKVISAQWWQCFGLCILFVLVALMGLLACLVGVYVAMPVIMAAGAYAYEDIFGVGATPPAEPV